MAAFAVNVTHGFNLVGWTDFLGTTVAGYITAAAANSCLAERPDLYLVNRGKSQGLAPVIAAFIDNVKAWEQPRPSYEPVTSEMFAAIKQAHCTCLERRPNGSLDLVAAAADWVYSGSFTGSRLAEYGQSKKKKGQAFATVPDNLAANEWRSTALAAIVSDYTFLDRGNCIRHRHHPSVFRIRIRFRFNKSPKNFQYCTFLRTRHEWLCMVLASISILDRVEALGVKPGEPLGVFRSSDEGHFWYIGAKHMQEFLGAAVDAAFPDKTHIAHQHKHKFSAHSLRVTAAMVLLASGVVVKIVSHRLRWNSDAIL